MLLNMSMVYKCSNYKYVYTLFLNYKVLAPPSLMCESISLVGIRELRATLSWWKPLPESLSRYISPLGVHHSDIYAFGASYGVIGFWGRLLVCHMVIDTRLVHG